MTCIGVTWLLRELPREFPSQRQASTLWSLPCFMWLLWSGRFVTAPSKTADMGFPQSSSLMLASCKYLLVNCCSLLSSQKGQIIWRSNKPRWAGPIGVAHSTGGLFGEAIQLHGSGVISCACFELWLKYMYLHVAETCRIKTNFNLTFKGFNPLTGAGAHFRHPRSRPFNAT